jgi:hypothetical protein
MYLKVYPKDDEQKFIDTMIFFQHFETLLFSENQNLKARES